MNTRKVFSIVSAIIILTLIIAACGSPSGDKKKKVKTDPLNKNQPAGEVDADSAPGLPFWVYVPAGEFEMGSDEDDPQANEDEFPRHAVRLPGFWIMTTEATNGLYAQCVQEGECSPPEPAESGPGSHYGDENFNHYPVVGVNWAQAEEFCDYVDGTLPSEAQWEKAARGYFGWPYPWGSANPTCDLANMTGCLEDLARVGSYEQGQSPFGLRDMAGNTREWVNDRYDPDAYEGSALMMPTGPEEGSLRVMRGGSFMDSAGEIRASARFSADPEDNFEDVGFRCVSDTLTTHPFCSTSYRPNCSPSDPGDPGDEPCDPGQHVQYENPAKASISCPQKGVGEVKIGFSDPVASISVVVNGATLPCTPDAGSTFTCTGAIPAAGEEATITVCSKSVPLALEDGFLGLEEVSCTIFHEIVSVGDTISYASIRPVAELLPGLQVTQNLVWDGSCPPGHTWDWESNACVRNENPGENPDYEGYCLEGYIFDPNLLCCVPAEPGICEEGFYLAAANQPCVEIPPNGCPQGYVYDPYLGCIHQPQDGDGGTPGQQNGFTCPPGQVYIQGKGCVTEGAIAQCPEGQYYDASSDKCFPLNPDGCQPGTYFDQKLKQCMPVIGPWTGCPQGYLLNPKTGCCVPMPGNDNTDCPGYDTVLLIGTEGQLVFDPADPDCPPPPEVDCPPGTHPGADGIFCHPNAECPPGTGPTPNNPYGCYPQGTEPCPPGFEMSNYGMGCVPIMMDGFQVQCMQSQYYDPVLGMCLDRTDDCCAQGFYYDTQIKICLPYPVDQNCPPGYFFKEQQCLPYAQQLTICQSFTLTVPQCPPDCPQGTHWDPASGQCLRDNPCAGVNCSAYGPNQERECTANPCCRWQKSPTGAGSCVRK